jgi:uncharacterized protein
MENRKSVWLRPELVASWPEIILVVLIVIGQSALKSTLAAWQGSSSHYYDLLLSDHKLISVLAVEGGLLGALLGYLHWRGWTAADFKLKPGWISSLLGILLVPVGMIINSTVVLTGMVIAFRCQSHFLSFVPFLTSQVQRPLPHSIHLGWISLILAVTLNAFFEELTCMGYAFSQFAAKRGPVFALILTVVLRMSCHSYQGFVHMLGIGALFTFFGLVYWRTKNLWILIVAHTIIDALSFSAIKILYGS